MAVTRISQSSLKQGLKKNKNFVAGIPPVLGKFDSIQTITVGAGGAASITFSNIPQTYRHLQVRMITRTTSATDNRCRMRLNGDSTAANYSAHLLNANGSAVGSSGAANFGQAIGSALCSSSRTANSYATSVIDICDYSATTKNKTIRCFSGLDDNTSGEITLWTSGWYQTVAVNSLTLYWEAGSHAQFSTAALYGVRS